MQMDSHCLPCLINQVVKVADFTQAPNRDALFRKVFSHLAAMDFSLTNPEIIGAVFRILKEHIQNEDPYLEIRNYYNELFSTHSRDLQEKIQQAPQPFHQAIKYAILGNIIDFNPMHTNSIETILQWFSSAEEQVLTIDHTEQLLSALSSAKTLLYLGDNCGEICLDLLLLQMIRERFPQLSLYFGVRGKPVVNDSIEADAYQVGIHQYATVISNGDDSLGTILPRTSPEFQAVYQKADVVLAKGQANYESLNEERDKHLFFLLMAKCDVIANLIGVPCKSLLCLEQCPTN